MIDSARLIFKGAANLLQAAKVMCGHRKESEVVNFFKSNCRISEKTCVRDECLLEFAKILLSTSLGIGTQYSTRCELRAMRYVFRIFNFITDSFTFPISPITKRRYSSRGLSKASEKNVRHSVPNSVPGFYVGIRGTMHRFAFL